MAVAVKNTPEVGSPSPFDRMPIVGLLGAGYIIGCLGVLGFVLPQLWWEVLGLTQSATTTLSLILVLALAAAGLGYLGLWLLGKRAPVGTRAAIFVAFVGLLLILLLTRWASLWIEYWVYFQHWFGPNGIAVGAALTGAIGIALVGVGVYYFAIDKRFEPYLVTFEEQGWFSATTFKGLQGLRVRRGTIVGILVIVGAGIWTLITHGTLERGSADWAINIPFTGRELVTNDTKGDAGEALAQRFPDHWDRAKNQLAEPVWIDRYTLRDINEDLTKKVRITYRGVSEIGRDNPIVPEVDFKAEVARLTASDETDLPAFRQLNPASGDEVSRYVRIRNKGDSDFADGAVVPMTELQTEIDKLKSAASDDQSKLVKKLPKWVPLTLSTGTEVYTALTLLPDLQYTIPLLLIAVSLWVSWRMVNYPAFADFLIATEAELNKVSWATRRRLVQDTIVVLLCVFLTAVFLFTMDQAWSHLLSWKQIGVIQINREQTDTKKTIENRPW